jgi:hypothetical protein
LTVSRRGAQFVKLDWSCPRACVCCPPSLPLSPPWLSPFTVLALLGRAHILRDNPRFVSSSVPRSHLLPSQRFECCVLKLERSWPSLSVVCWIHTDSSRVVSIETDSRIANRTCPSAPYRADALDTIQTTTPDSSSSTVFPIPNSPRLSPLSPLSPHRRQRQRQGQLPRQSHPSSSTPCTPRTRFRLPTLPSRTLASLRIWSRVIISSTCIRGLRRYQPRRLYPPHSLCQPRQRHYPPPLLGWRNPVVIVSPLFCSWKHDRSSIVSSQASWEPREASSPSERRDSCLIPHDPRDTSDDSSGPGS